VLVDENSIWHDIEVKHAAQLASAVDDSWKGQVLRKRLWSPWVDVYSDAQEAQLGSIS